MEISSHRISTISTRRRSLKKIARNGLVSSLALMVGFAASVSADQIPETFDMAAMPLAKAIAEFSKQTGMVILTKGRSLENKKAGKLSGTYEPEEALRILLKNSGLVYGVEEDNTVIIRPEGISDRPVSGFLRISSVVTLDYEENLSAYEGDEVADDTDDFSLDEIIVTATRRAESLQDVGMSIKALGSAEINTRGLQAMGDYLTSVPSVSFNEKGGGRNQITIRGVSSGVSASGSDTTAFYFGEIPVSSTARGNPDLKLFDIERIEILRGPQGTLFGANAMGGAVRVIPNGAEFDAVSGSVEATLSTTKQGGTNYNVSGAFNFPLIEDKLAIRVVGYTYDNSGFVDNKITGGAAFGIADAESENVTGEKTHGGRLALAFQPTDNLLIEASVLIQDQTTSGLPEVTVADGDWSQNRWIPENLRDDFQVYNLTFNYEGKGFDVVASASFMDRQWYQNRDIHAFGILGPDTPVGLFDSNDEEIFVQEVRVSSNNDNRFQWLFGGYHSKKNLHFTNGLFWFGSEASALAIFPAVLPVNSFVHRRDNDISDEQYALFGEVSYQITDKLKATAGLRWFTYDNIQNLTVAGIFQNQQDLLATSATTYTPKFALNFQATEDQLYYASATNGFRPGGAARPLPSACDADLNDAGFTEQPDGTTPDSLWSYEAGTKLNMADGRVAFSAAAYYIDWTNIPTGTLLRCGFSFVYNADSASVKGLEMEVAVQAAENLRFDIGGSYNDAQLDPSLNPVTGLVQTEGGRTPGVARFTTTVGAEYDFTIAEWDSLLRMDAHYVGASSNGLPGVGLSTPSGDYTVVNLRWSTDFDGWNVELFATNLFDETVNIVVDTELPDNRTYRGRPRTIGARLRYNF